MTAVRMNAAALRPYTPYVAAWSTETPEPTEVISVPGLGVAYRDEVLTDRDRRGVLWLRIASRPGRGDPQFGRVHSLRQRRAMRRMLCGVCGNPAGNSGDGAVWLLRDHRGDWPGWPVGMGVTEPPTCLPCARLAVRMCPALRDSGAVLVRVREAPLSGVRGLLYRGAGRWHVQAVDEVLMSYGDPRLPWVVAYHQLRDIHDATLLDPKEFGLCTPG